MKDVLPMFMNEIDIRVSPKLKFNITNKKL